jgi:hypothetical protein
MAGGTLRPSSFAVTQGDESALIGDQLNSTVRRATPIGQRAPRPASTDTRRSFLGEHPRNVLDIEAQTPACAAQPDGAELLGVRIDPAAVDREERRKRRRVDIAMVMSCRAEVEQLRDTPRDRVYV